MPHKFSDDQIVALAQGLAPDDLPGDLPEVADIIGVESTLRLALTIGVGRIYLRRWSSNPGSWSSEIRIMVDVIGRKDVEAVVANFNGAHVDIPKCERFFRQMRDASIRESIAGKRQVDVARHFNLSDRHVRRIARNVPDDRQGELF